MKYLYFDSKKELMNWYLEKIFHDNGKKKSAM